MRFIYYTTKVPDWTYSGQQEPISLGQSRTTPQALRLIGSLTACSRKGKNVISMRPTREPCRKIDGA